MTHHTQKEHNKKEMVYHLYLTKCELIETNCELTRTKAKLNDKLDETVQELSQTTMDLKITVSLLIGSILLRHFFSFLGLLSFIQLLRQVMQSFQSLAGFSMKVKSAERWQSSPFYTNTKGYRMLLRVDAGGNGMHKYTHCSMLLYLKQGQYDDAASWPLNEELQIIFLNQTSDI